MRLGVDRNIDFKTFQFRRIPIKPLSHNLRGLWIAIDQDEIPTVLGRGFPGGPASSEKVQYEISSSGVYLDYAL